MSSALITLWLAVDTTGRLVAVAAVGLAVWAILTSRRRWMGAVVGATLAWVLGGLGDGPFHGSTVIFAVVAALPMVWSAAHRLPRGRIRLIAKTTSVAAGLTAFASTVFGLGAILAVGDVSTAIDHAKAGFDLASDGDEDAASVEFDDASEAFDRARWKVSGFWTLPARLIPVVGQHAKAFQVVTSEGMTLSDTAADTARSVDPDDVRLVAGGIDLTVIDELAPVLARVEMVITRARERVADADSPWLVSQVDRRLADLAAELDAAAPAAETAALAAAEVPGMLGASSPVDWLLLLTSPAESRGLGGLVGNYVVVRADDGRVDIVDSGRNEDLNRGLEEVGAELNAPPQYLDRWGAFSPERFFQDVTLSPDLPSVAAVAANLYEQTSDTTIEGVLVLDPFAVEAILDLSGPVDAGGIRLTESTVVDFLLVGQYEHFEDDDVARVAALGQLVSATFDAFTSGALPGPRGLAQTIGTVIEADRLGIWWAAGGGPSTLVDSAGLDGRFPSSNGGDLFGLVQQNSGQNKIDVYLERTIDYRITVDDGTAEAIARVALTNGAPAEGLPLSVIGSNDQGYPLGTNVALMSVHTALDVSDVRIDGTSTPIVRSNAFGDEAATFTVVVPSMTTVIVEIDLVGRLDSSERDAYRLELPHQPLVNSDVFTVTATIDGIEYALLAESKLEQDTTVTVTPE